MLIKYKNFQPKLVNPAFVADSANIIGNVTIEKDSSIWFGSVLRGDVNSILVKEKTNIQDLSIIHVSESHPTIIGEGVTIGHRVILHACKIGNYSLIGMGAIVLDGASIGNFSLIAAGALILQNTKIPDGVLVAGMPGKIIRNLTEDEMKSLELSSLNYVEYAKSY